jgi:hemolysin activation/secretion protein
MVKRSGAAWFVALVPYAAIAAAAAPAAPVPPGAGSLLQQIQPVEPPPAPGDNPGLVIEPQGGATLPPTAPFPVTSLQISGNTAFDTATLHALIAGAEGKDLTLPELNGWVVRITDFYHAHGFPLARALIPAQTIRDGVVSVEVIEARYGKILLENHSRVSDALFDGTLAPLKSGQVIGQTALNHALLLLSDTPGAVPSATVKPGEAAGTSDLLVQVTPGPAVTGNVTADNYGNRYTGRARIGGEIALSDPLHHGDVLDASVLSSGKDMEYGRVTYDFLLNGAGTHLGASYSALHYALGDSLASLEGHGTADVASVWAKQPLVRSVNVDLYAQLQLDRKVLKDDIDVSAIHTHRHLDNWTANLAGDERDAMWSGGVTTWSLGLTSGRLGFDDAMAEIADAATADTRGAFLQGNATLARLQRMTAKDSLYLTVSWQWANANLDPSQKMVAGGPYTVRAYDMSALSGDGGIQTSVEWRRDLAAWHGQWQAVAFVDTERLNINENVWTAGTNTATLNGAGLGLNWTGPNQWTAKASVATRLGPVPDLGNASSSTRAWLSIAKGF